MKLFTDLVTTPYGLMSLGSIFFTIGMGIWFLRHFMKKIREDEKNAGM